MNLRQKSSQFLYLASAFALPPKIVSMDWSLRARTEAKIPERRARSVELLSHVPQEISNAAERAKSSPAKLTTVGERFEFREGIFQVSGKQLAFILREQKDINLWSIPVGFEALRWERTATRTGLVGWDLYPSKIFLLDWGDRGSGAKAQGYRIDWSEDSEILRVFECRYGQWVIVENLPNGMTRLYFVDRNSDGALSLRSQTVFDFNPKGNSSEVFRVENEGCQTFWFSGTFGKARVRY